MSHSRSFLNWTFQLFEVDGSSSNADDGFHGQILSCSVVCYVLPLFSRSPLWVHLHTYRNESRNVTMRKGFTSRASASVWVSVYVFVHVLERNCMKDWLKLWLVCPTLSPPPLTGIDERCSDTAPWWSPGWLLQHSPQSSLTTTGWWISEGVCVRECVCLCVLSACGCDCYKW